MNERIRKLLALSAEVISEFDIVPQFVFRTRVFPGNHNKFHMFMKVAILFSATKPFLYLPRTDFITVVNVCKYLSCGETF